MKKDGKWAAVVCMTVVLAAAGCHSKEEGKSVIGDLISGEPQHGGEIPEETEEIHSGYYYNQLAEEEKGIYRQLLKGIQEFQGEVEIKLMNEMKYDAMTIGNHEFDFDLPNMARLFKMANFPVVCSNYDVSATVLKDLVKPYIIIERSGAKIGVFGLGAKLEGLVQATKCVGVIYNDPVQAANDVAAKLKEQGCDAVVCLSHLGVEYDRDELIPQTRNIDIVLGGHSHTFMQEPENTNKNLDGRIVPLLHTGANGIYVGKVELPINKKQ